MAVLAQDLRDAVLQYALQGKLTEQLDSDSSVEELLAKIKTEKEQLIKDKKIKKEKPLPEIEDDEIPYDIPRNWSWIRLGNVSQLVTKGTTPKTGYVENGIPFLRAENVVGLGNLDISNTKYVNETTHLGELSRSVLCAGDILITIAGTLGRTAIVKENQLPLNTNQAVSFVRLVNADSLNKMYLIYAINSPIIQYRLVKQKKITAIPNLTLEHISNMVLPIPPIEEQTRIVAKVEEIMQKIDEYEKIEKQLEEIKKAFPMDMRDALLQAAMQGKLTEQLNTDSSVDDLIEKIKTEREKLIKEQKGKKGKIQQNTYFVELPKDEYPYDIPENWKFSKLENILTLDKGKKLSGTKYNYLEAKYLRTLANPTIKDSGEFVEKGTYTILVDGENSGEVFKIPEDGYMGSTYKVLNMTSELNTEFILYFLNYHRRYLRDNKKGSAIPHLNKTIFYDLAFPIPPIEEQQRIVEILDRLLPLCESL